MRHGAREASGEIAETEYRRPPFRDVRRSYRPIGGLRDLRSCFDNVSRASTIPVERFWSRPWRRRQSISSDTCIAPGAWTGWRACSLNSATTSIRKRLVEASQSASILWAQRLGLPPGACRSRRQGHAAQGACAKARAQLHQAPARRGCRGGAAVEGLAAVGERKHRDRSLTRATTSPGGASGHRGARISR